MAINSVSKGFVNKIGGGYCKNVIIVGAGGHAKVVADIVIKSGDRIVGFLDSIRSTGEFVGFPILGSNEDYTKFADEYYFVIAIGNPIARERIAQNMNGVKWYTALHPTVNISNIDVSIGEGTVAVANSIINSGAKIGKHCIINTGASIDHDDKIDDFVHVAPGAVIAGNVNVDSRTWIGAGSVIKDHTNICKDCIIGIGAAVIKDIVESGTYAGVPAKKLINSKFKF